MKRYVKTMPHGEHTQLMAILLNILSNLRQIASIKTEVDAQGLALAALTQKQSCDIAAVNSSIDTAQRTLTASIGALEAQTADRFTAVGSSVQAVNSSLTDLIQVNARGADAKYAKVVEGVQALLSVLRDALPSPPAPTTASIGASAVSPAPAPSSGATEGSRGVARASSGRRAAAAVPRLYNLRFHGSLSEMKFPAYTMKSAVIVRSVTKTGSGALHVMTGDSCAYLVASKGVTVPGTKGVRFNAGFADEIAIYKLTIPNIGAEVTEDNAQEYVAAILDHNKVSGFGAYSVDIDNLVYAMGSGPSPIVALASYTGNGRNVADATLQYTVSVHTADPSSISDLFKGSDFKVTPLPSVDVAHPQAFFAAVSK